MDRFCYKGPVWEGKGVPKSIIEEVDPLYRYAPAEEDPSKREDADETYGDKEFEYVVR